MVAVRTSIDNRMLHTCFCCLLPKQCPDGFGCFKCLPFWFHVMISRCSQRASSDVINELRINMLQAALDRQTRTRGGARNTRTHTMGATSSTTTFCNNEVLHTYSPDLAAFPALRRICSVVYLIPFPLYGSGLRIERICAATAPNTTLSAEVRVRTFFSTVALTPAGKGISTSWENPTSKTTFCPCTFTLYPTPITSSDLLNPSETPFTRFATFARVVPQIARPKFSSGSDT